MLPIDINRPLKTVTDRMQSCRTVVGALEAHGDQLVRLLGTSFDPLLGEGEVMPFATQLALFRKRLIQDRDQLVESDRAYRDQRAQESLFRGQRDEEAKEVNADVVGLRRAFTGIYSEEKLAEFGFARRTPQNPGELQEQAIHLARRLQDPDLDLSGSRFGEFRLEASVLTGKLAQSVEALGDRIDDLTREERKSEALKLAKDDALKEYNRSFLWIARTVESLCRLAGLDEVARRVRPSSRRPGETETEPEEPEDGAVASEDSQESPPTADPAETPPAQ